MHAVTPEVFKAVKDHMRPSQIIFKTNYAESVEPVYARGQQEEGCAWLRNRLESMRKAGADCVTVICPQCYQQYDTGQMMAARKLGIPFKVPALFYLQLLGLAMGYSLEEMQYGSHRVRDSGFEEKVRKITAA